ncbi:HAD family hydrolase [Meridianimarinicoccus roseus]|uniref:HAD family hydrolase n=1 Tax=Meridianimarinicoccus roseus TaxID=2072018 RepID=A0A2V2L6H0_9RHOB|nr:HAD family hydrolase [Meridianimarinicoccus roseus]PWR00982.1 HAD family hydrolase [Meridianimarinicoccus roseus]
MPHRLLPVAAIVASLATAAMSDPLPSWNDTDAKARVVAFVENVTDPASDDYVTAADRIAVFDNDGTLWAEQPIYFQFLYAMDRLAVRAADDPSVLTSDVLRAAAEGDIAGAMAGGEEGLLEVVMQSHAGLSVDDFQADVRAWLDTAVHPQTGQPIRDMLYQPMLELLRYLRDEGFSTYIVSGGGVHFMRAFAEDAYGIPPSQVIGSAGKSSYQIIDGVPTIMKDPGIAFIDDKEGKPLGIDSKIGQRPIFVGGNSDGDFAMLEWATAGPGPRLGLIVHHTDADREWAYDRDSHVGRLDRGLDEGPARGWVIVDMASDWADIWP